MDRPSNSPPRPVFVVSSVWLAIVAVAAVVVVGASQAEATIVAGTLFSPSHGRSFEYRVITPPGYSAADATRYPVVFSLHGNGGTPSQRAGNYNSTLTQKMTSGEIVPMIWVFPDGQMDSYYGNAYDGHKQVYTHIIQELLPHIDATFKTIADRDHRAMEGFSMGGFGSGLYGAKNTDLFSATLLMGAVLPDWDDLLRREPDTALEMYDNVETNWLPYSIYDVTAANAEAIRTTVNYKQIIGDADGHRAGNEIFRDYLLSLGIDPQYQVLPGVTHSGGLYLDEGSGLAFLSDHFLLASQVSAPGDYNNDGIVDATDYTVWRNHLGTNFNLSGHGDETVASAGVVDEADYTWWKQHYGNSYLGTGGGGLTGSTVPEPPTQAMLLVIALSLLARRTMVDRGGVTRLPVYRAIRR